jgi:predicted alpha/beta superfamily hydrolase
VLYLHDGQNVFSSAGTNISFGWGSWDLDKTADELCRAGKMKEIILVAVDNTDARYVEYCGRHHSADTNGNTEFENYTAFLIQDLKPKIDSTYRTRLEPANTGIMGSSLGGICSIVLAWEHPDVFGRAASLSGAFQVERTNFLNSILRPYQGKAKPMRLYLDSGVVDFTGGDDGQKLTTAIAEEFRRIHGRRREEVPGLQGHRGKAGLTGEPQPERNHCRWHLLPHLPAH